MTDREKEALIRRYNSNIRLNGRYYIFFGLWAAVRTLIMILLDDSVLGNAFDNVDGSILWFVKLITMIIIFLVLLFVLSIHLFVGISAIKYSSGRSKNRIFLVIAAIDVIFIALLTPFDFDNGINAPAIAAAAVDLTQMTMLINMIYSAMRIKSLKKAAKE